MAAAPRVQVRRIYDDPAKSDGTRVLVDRVWPRGMSRETAHIDEWRRDIAPSTELRKWYGHDHERFEEFTRRYLVELQEPERMAALTDLRSLARRGPVTLLTATKEPEFSQAAVLVNLVASGRTRKLA
ncbi:MAG TPA: DUF488 family protein [Mycobacteriales bacterium]|jgi:uncharacterized protein YeaO (DUF488 family)|nr:DUF488 family protein [Mycobacteriales bacterium]